MSRYTQLPDDSVHESQNNPIHQNVERDIEMAPSRSLSQQNTIQIKVLFKDKSLSISTLSLENTVLDLKIEIQTLTSVSCDNQRLIFGGRALRPDEAKLSSFNIANNCSVHLFPRPPNMPPSAGSNSERPSSSSTASNNPTVVANEMDPNISQSADEIKLWSTILIFLCILTIFDYFNRVVTTGSFGYNTFDNLANIVETMCSVAGIFVGQMGLQSVRTYDVETVQKYVRALLVVAVASVITRFVLVVDFVFVIKQLLRKMHEDEESKPSNTNPTTLPVSDSKVILSYTLQASLIAIVCLIAWSHCVIRARRFQSNVILYRGPRPVQ